MKNPTTQAPRRRRRSRQRAIQPRMSDRLLRSVARIAGRDPSLFAGSELPDGQVVVRGANAIAVYPGPAWLSRLCRHLYEGYFDVPRGPTPA